MGPLLCWRPKCLSIWRKSRKKSSSTSASNDQLTANRKATRTTYLLLLALITLFILFVATWIALFMARQIIVPITALLEASRQVRKGNLAHRVDVQAVDELASPGPVIQRYD